MMRKIFYLLALSICATFSCTKSAIDVADRCLKQDLSCVLIDDVSFAVIGEKVENPLSITNILRAYDFLEGDVKSGVDRGDILPTHHYVTFMPETDEDLDELLLLDDLSLFSYPLDYDVSDGQIVPDERFMKNGFSFMWAYVPVGFCLESVRCPHIINYDVFSPVSSVKSINGMTDSFVDSIIQRSYDLCGQATPLIPTTKSSAVSPSGCIRFWDHDTNRYRGVDGLSIRTYSGAHSSYTHCDANGDFQSDDSFRYSFSYEIHFSRTDFSVRKNGGTNEVTYKYSGYTGPFYAMFNDEEASFFANVSRAAIVYYYRNINGLRRPPMRDDRSYKLAIQAYIGSGDRILGSYYDQTNWIFPDRPKISVYRLDNDSPVSCRLVYATTLHELAHASHWRDNELYDVTSSELKETFAMGVEWFLTTMAYPDYQPDYYRQSYTGIIEDLIDDDDFTVSDKRGVWIDGSFVSTYSYLSAIEYASGFLIEDLEDYVRGSRSWAEFESRVMSSEAAMFQTGTISDLFSFWMRY